MKGYIQWVLEQAEGIKPSNYDNVFFKNNEFKKQHNLLKIKLKAFDYGREDADLWWDVMQDVIQKDVGKKCKNV